MKLAKHPVNNFGRLAKFARGQWDDVLVGHNFDGLHPQLKAEGQAVARLTKRLAKSIIRLLGKYREGILDMELIHSRVASVVIEMYAMAAVISKLQWMLEKSPDVLRLHLNTNGNGKDSGNGNGNGHHAMSQLERDLLVGKSYCHHAAERVELALQALFNHNDRETIKVADAVMGV
jgi:hypothetical protein